MKKIQIRKTNRVAGFSLVEMLLTMALLTGLVGISLTIYMGFLSQNQLESVRSSVMQSLTSAQANSAAEYMDSQWGVYITTSSATLFKGSSYATRDTSQDFLYNFASLVGVSGPTEVVFSKLYGFPSATGNINLSLKGKTISIQLNSRNIVSY